MDTNGFSDIHMHIIPGVDDGSATLDMSMKMLAMAWDEGIRTVFATPHYGTGSCIMTSYDLVEQQYIKLKERASTQFPDMRIFRGNEIYYEDQCISNWIEKGKACSMEHSKYILFEFSHYCPSNKIEHALLSVLDKGWWPILAHTERYPQFQRHLAAIERLYKCGVYLQINAYSLEEEKDTSIKNFARQIAENELAHFIGSDAHKDYRRTPSMRSGVDFLYEKCRKGYVDDLVQGNAEHILHGVRI